MSFQLDCPACRKAITATDDLLGRPVACPHCSTHFRIPARGARPLVRSSSARSDYVAPIRFTFTCQRCGSILEGASDVCGERGRCPTCGAVFVVPSVDRKTGLPTGPAEVADDGEFPTPVHAYAAAGDKAPQIRRLDSGEQIIICPRCAARMPIDAHLCTTCGIPFTIEGAAAISKSAPGGNGMATAALVAGIVSLPLFIFGVVLGPAAIGLGVAGLRRAGEGERNGAGRKRAIAGIICGGVSLGIFLVTVLL